MKNSAAYPLLDTIRYPSDLRAMPLGKLPAVCDELRSYLIDTISTYGGHFNANLGVVELTVALHYVFNTPDDKLVWDVGHQAYAHKLLTGRKDLFHTNRLQGGISGFPKISESKYDAFGTGHSSTSISAALGMAMAAQLLQLPERQHIAVIGDGALTGGMAFEGLNHAGTTQANLLVVLNDNSMSIDPSAGALKDYLNSLSAPKTDNLFREEVLSWVKNARENGLDEALVRKLEQSADSLLSKDVNFFESLKFSYSGPVDGHDVLALVARLQELKKEKGPRLLHLLTLKGKGYAPAEKEQTKWHAPGLFDKVSGEIAKTPKKDRQPAKYQDVFGHTLLELAQQNDKIVGITPAMPSGCSMNIMMDIFPERVFDVGIAEQHAVTFAAGLAASGMVPFCNLYSTFAQRAYDQIIHDVCVQNLPVVFCLDRAGLAGSDGPTHHGTFDMAFLRCLPNMVVAAPLNEEELRNLMFTAQRHRSSPFSIRYPRGEGVMAEWRQPLQELPIGKGQQLKTGKHTAIVSIGHIGNEALKAARAAEAAGIEAAVFDMRYVKPLDESLLHSICRDYETIISVEDGCISGGFGSAVLEFMAANGYTNKIKLLGIPDHFIEQGTQQELYALCGYDATGIEKTLLDS